MPDSVLPRDGLVIVAKRDCPTCVLVEPVMQSLDRAGPLAVVSQDDPTFPSGVRSVFYDDELERSFRLNIEAVPTLIRFKDGREVERTVGWERKEWMRLAGDAAAGNGLPDWQPGCGSKSVEPGVHEALIARYGDPGLKSREIAVGNWDDPMEACFERGWTDGLPGRAADRRAHPAHAGRHRAQARRGGGADPAQPRVLHRREGGDQRRDGGLQAGVHAGGAGRAGGGPRSAVRAARPALHHAFLRPAGHHQRPGRQGDRHEQRRQCAGSGQPRQRHDRPCAAAHRRNVGGGLPGAIDRATLGNPGKYTFCFAEDESDPDWEPLSVRRGIAPGKSAVTLFHGEGVHGFIDQRSRTPEELVRSLAMGLFGVGHPKLCDAGNAVLVLSPEHYKIFKDGGWNRRRIEDELFAGAEAAGPRPHMGRAGRARGPAAQIRRPDRRQVPAHARRRADRSRRRRGRAILRHHRRLARPARARGMPVRHQGDSPMNSQTKLRDPTAESSPVRRARLVPPPSLDGKTVALMDIGKSRGAEFIDRLEGHFKKAGVATRRYAKPTNTKVAPTALMQQIAAENQLAVIALSD